MALSSAQIVRMIKAPVTGVNAGRAQFAAHQAADVPSHSKFAADMAALPVPQRSKYVHPQDAIRTNTAKLEALNPADLMWLDRLPRDPAAVPFDDAVQLAGMYEGLAKNQPTGSSDRRLVESIWQPVSEHHDAKAADVAVANASQPLPPIPPSALQALADAVAAEVPQLSDAEVMARAGEMLRQALDERAAAHNMKGLDAHLKATKAPQQPGWPA